MILDITFVSFEHVDFNVLDLAVYFIKFSSGNLGGKVIDQRFGFICNLFKEISA